MAKTKPKASEQKAWRFYRSNLSTIVWDPKSEQPMADFSAGHFTTDDPKVARKLIDIGYPEIPIDATEPPSNIIVSQPTRAIDGDVPVIKSLMIQAIAPTPTQEKAVEKNLAARTRSVGGPPALKSEKQVRSGGIMKLPRRRKKKTA